MRLPFLQRKDGGARGGAGAPPERERVGAVKTCVFFLLRNSWTIGFWTITSLFGFGVTAFNASLTRARFNREMEVVKKSIETNVRPSALATSDARVVTDRHRRRRRD